MTQGYRYPMRKCPYCGRFFANVKNHIAMKHQAEPAELSRGDLLGEPKPEPVKDPDPEFFCLNCGAFVKRGDRECWRCGEDLQWEA